MKIVVDFAQSWYIVEFNPFLGKNGNKYQKEFEKWYYEEYTETIEGKKLVGKRKRSDLPYKVFDITPIVDWMKEVSPDANPIVIDYGEWDTKYDKKLPAMYF